VRLGAPFSCPCPVLALPSTADCTSPGSHTALCSSSPHGVVDGGAGEGAGGGVAVEHGARQVGDAQAAQLLGGVERVPVRYGRERQVARSVAGGGQEGHPRWVQGPKCDRLADATPAGAEAPKTSSARPADQPQLLLTYSRGPAPLRWRWTRRCPPCRSARPAPSGATR